MPQSIDTIDLVHKTRSKTDRACNSPCQTLQDLQPCHSYHTSYSLWLNDPQTLPPYPFVNHKTRRHYDPITFNKNYYTSALLKGNTIIKINPLSGLI